MVEVLKARKIQVANVPKVKAVIAAPINYLEILHQSSRVVSI
jgi:hypothetical protein